MRRRLRTALILIATVGLVAFFLRDADMAGVWAETRRADARLLLLAFVATIGTYVIRAWRWQSMLAPLGPTRFSTALRTTIIGFAASAVLPARAGEVLRPYLLARREHLNATAAFATIIIERLIDLATVLVLFGFFVLFMPAGAVSADSGQLGYVKFWGGLASVGAVAGMMVLFVLAGHPERLGRAALRVERVLPARIAAIVASFVETFAQGLAVMRSPVRLFEALALSFPLWLTIALQIWLTSQAFHITFPFTGTFLVVLFLVVGVAVPTPGQIGGFHAAYEIAVTTFFAVPPDRAVGAAIVLHAMSFLPVLVVGLILMAREGLTFSGARQLAEQNAQ
jgi:glycosyltransferase 2 family protein